MFEDVEVEEGRDRTLFIYPREPGQVQRIDEFWAIRAGVSWPTARAPGYYCLIGAKADLEAADGISLVLIDEGESVVLEKLFERLMIKANRFNCSSILARLDGDKGPERAFYRFRSQRDIDCPGLLDSSVFENFNQDIPLIRQWIEKGALRVASGSCLRNQLASLGGDDLKDDFEERFYAVASLCRVLKSLDIWPVGKAIRTQGLFFTNIKDRGKSKDSGYWEIITE